MADVEVREYDLCLKEVKLNLRAPKDHAPFKMREEDGVKFTHIIREFDGTVRDAYLDDQKKSVNFSPDGKTGQLKTFKNVYANLLSRCIHDADDELVSLDEIQSWPSSVQKELHKIARELNALGAEAEGQAKND